MTANSLPHDAPKYTHAVVHDIYYSQVNAAPKRSDHMDYCFNVEQAHALAMQGMASGWQNVAIITLKPPVDVNSV